MTNKALSPLRYPGGKTRHAHMLAEYVLEGTPKTFADPFGGGGSALLAVADLDPHIKLHYNDMDARIAALFHVVSSPNPRMFNKLIRLLEDTEPSLGLFDALGPQHFSPSPIGYAKRGKVELAYAGLVRNRLAFSGVMHAGAGPKGGRASNGDIGERWYGATVIKRLHNMRRLLVGRTTVTCGDFADVPSADAMIIDPPYVRKADKLYAHWFTLQDHIRLADYVHSLHGRWVVTYDNDPLVEQLYMKDTKCVHDMTYSGTAAGGQHLVKATELWVVSHV